MKIDKVERSIIEDLFYKSIMHFKKLIENECLYCKILQWKVTNKFNIS